MQTIAFQKIVSEVEKLCIKANCNLPKDVLSALCAAQKSEKSPLGKSILNACIENAKYAKAKSMPICQDTGLAVFFAELGDNVRVKGGLLKDAINKGVGKGYAKGYLRKSVVSDPLERVNTKNNLPAIIHIEIVKGSKLKIYFMPKGAGCENMSALAMLSPSADDKTIADFVAGAVIAAGANPCPPTVVGVGIGGNFETAPLLAKKALLRPLGKPNRNPRYARLEKTILAKINASGIGPQGLGGTITSLAVHIEYAPCHIASLPVAVNINCHAHRLAKIEL
ncbi:MAG: fumarate hydratase [Elusimicrobia bacterium]|nr:fumarate hydratase [Elusimicrobiota bacterium]